MEDLQQGIRICGKHLKEREFKAGDIIVSIMNTEAVVERVENGIYYLSTGHQIKQCDTPLWFFKN